MSVSFYHFTVLRPADSGIYSYRLHKNFQYNTDSVLSVSYELRLKLQNSYKKFEGTKWINPAEDVELRQVPYALRREFLDLLSLLGKR